MIKFVLHIVDEEGMITARPRRMSEVNTATKILPIPPGTSFFLFSQTNRFLCLSFIFPPNIESVRKYYIYIYITIYIYIYCHARQQ